MEHESQEPRQFTEEEKAAIGRYVAVIPQYTSRLWSMLEYIGSTRLGDDVDEMSLGCKVAENIHAYMPPDMRKFIEPPRDVVRARIKDVKEYGFKKLGFGFTEWELTHSTMSERQREMYRNERIATIYSEYLLQFITEVTNLFSQSGILLQQDTHTGQADLPTMEEFRRQEMEQAGAIERNQLPNDGGGVVE